MGDQIHHDSGLTKECLIVIRVTDKFAIVRQSEDITVKFPRFIPEVGLHPSGKRDIWSTVQYAAWRPVEDIKETETSIS